MVLKVSWRAWRTVAWGLATLSLIVGGVLWSFYDHQKNSPVEPQAVLDDFILTSTQGNLVRFREGKEPFVLLYFGYTYCPDICPLALTHITQTLNALDPKHSAQIQPLFVTVDPQRDTQDVLRGYASLFHPRLTYLTGTPEHIQPILKAYGVFAQRAHPDGTSMDYLVDHSSMIYWMKRDGTLLDRFSHATPPALLIEAIRPFLHP